MHGAFPSLGSGLSRHSLVLARLAGISRKSLLMVETVPSNAWPSVPRERDSATGAQLAIREDWSVWLQRAAVSTGDPLPWRQISSWLREKYVLKDKPAPVAAAPGWYK